jgi:hypothetical protein
LLGELAGKLGGSGTTRPVPKFDQALPHVRLVQRRAHVYRDALTKRHVGALWGKESKPPEYGEARIALFERVPMGTDRLQQPQRPDNVGLNERVRIVYRPVDMALGREVDDGFWPVFRQDSRDGLGVPDVGAKENQI